MQTQRGTEVIQHAKKMVVRADSTNAQDVSIYRQTREEGHPIQRAPKEKSTWHVLEPKSPAEGVGRRWMYVHCKAGNKVEKMHGSHIQKGLE